MSSTAETGRAATNAVKDVLSQNTGATNPGGREVALSIQAVQSSIFLAVLGLIFFIGLLWSTWPSFFDAYRIGEYEGEGALRVPTWPVRGTVLVMSVFGAWAYISMIVLDWRGKLIDELSAPGTVVEGD